MEEEPKSSIWLLINLWKPKASRFAYLPLLDLLIPDNKASSGFRWFFTDKQGMVRRKSEGNTTMEMICVKFMQDLFSSISPVQFLSQDKSDMIVANLINNDSSTSVTKAQFLGYLMKRDLNSNSALQLSKQGLCEHASKLVAEFKYIEGKYKWKFYKKYMQDMNEMTVSLTAQALCSTIKVYSAEAIKVIERNTRKRLVSGCVLYIEDVERKVWLSGFCDCKVVDLLKTEEKKIEIHVNGVVDSRLTNYSRTQLNQSKIDQSRNISMSVMERSASSKGNLLIGSRKKCPGDFCMYLLKSKTENEKNEIDYDDLLAKVRMAYSGDGNKEVTKMRLGIAVDYLQRERDKLKIYKLDFEIPYKAIVLGRSLLRNQVIEPPSGETLMELDISTLLNSSALQEQLEESSMDLNLTQDPYLHPSRLYDSIKVCERCYLFYIILQIVAKKATKPALNETISLPPIHKNLNSSLKPARTLKPPPLIKSQKVSCDMSEISSVASKNECQSEYLNTSLGRINKNNIDDLLADMNLALAELETGDNQGLKARLNKMYKFMTEDYKLHQEIKSKRAKSRASVSSLSPSKIEPSLEEDIAARFFPSENTVSWQPKQKEKLNLQNWKQYMRMLRAKKWKRHYRPPG
jgi:hypothetical protein